MNNKGSINIIKEFLVFGLVAGLVLLIPLFFIKVLPLITMPSQAQAPSSFTFTAAGDYGANSNAQAVLSAMNPTYSGSSLNLALGDLSYGNLTPETAWCDYVKSNAGSDLPFQLVSGNHEDDTPDGYNIDNFVQCLPDRTGNVNGEYGKEYYFDYPSEAPLVRFIMISPNLSFTNGGSYDYNAGSAHYNFVASAIDGARASGIPWVIAGMHKNCLSMGSRSCSIGNDLFQLLIEKRVDLVLHAHEHNYQRGKQLAYSADCPEVPTGSYNAGCVTDDGLDGNYTKGAGMVFAIVGTGGRGLYDVSTSDTDAPYFVSWSGSNSNPSWGFLKVTVNQSQLAAEFYPAVGSHSDSFTITDAGLPSPTPGAASPTVAVSPTPTPSSGTVTAVSQVSASADDAEEAIGSGSISLSSSDLELGAAGSTSQIVGMRFTNVNIPRDAVINSAYVEFEVDEVSTGTTSVTLSGQADDNAPAFSSTTGNISSRPKTLAFVDWNNIPPWDIVSAKHQTPDIANIVQEIVNRPGWAAGNSMVLTVVGTGKRTAESYNGEPPAAPKLVVEYSTEPTPTPTATPLPTPTPTIDPLAPTPTVTPVPTETPIPSPTPLASPTPAVAVFYPSMDAFVNDRSVDRNYGSATTVEIDGSPIKITYFKFDLTSLAGRTITNALLRLYITDSSSSTQNVKAVADTSWQEHLITYNNRPTLGGTLISFTGGSKGSWREIPLTAFVASKTGKVFSLGIDSSGSNGLDAYSKENSINKPELVVSYQ